MSFPQWNLLTSSGWSSVHLQLAFHWPPVPHLLGIQVHDNLVSKISQLTYKPTFIPWHSSQTWKHRKASSLPTLHNPSPFTWCLFEIPSVHSSSTPTIISPAAKFFLLCLFIPLLQPVKATNNTNFRVSSPCEKRPCISVMKGQLSPFNQLFIDSPSMSCIRLLAWITTRLRKDRVSKMKHLL